MLHNMSMSMNKLGASRIKKNKKQTNKQTNKKDKQNNKIKDVLTIGLTQEARE